MLWLHQPRLQAALRPPVYHHAAFLTVAAAKPRPWRWQQRHNVRAAAQGPAGLSPEQPQLQPRSRPSGSSSSTGDAHSPLHCRLAEAGVPDWATYDSPHHAALSGEAAVADYAAKAAQLAREGLAAADVDRLFLQPGNSPRACNFDEVFLPNLDYLRGLFQDVKITRASYEPAGLTALGRLLRNQPRALALVLSRDPGLIQELDGWVCRELGLLREKFGAAAMKYPILLWLPVENGRAVLGFLLELGVPRGDAVRSLLRQPQIFALKPETLAKKIEWLEQCLGVSERSHIIEMFLEAPLILQYSLSELPAVLVELDSLFAKPGAGAELVLRSPILATVTVARLKRAVQALCSMGLSTSAVQEAVCSIPSLLIKDLERPCQQQKLAWARAELPHLSFSKLMAGALFGFSLRSMASRLAFMRYLGLPEPARLSSISMVTQARFLKAVGKGAGWEVGAAEFEAFVAAWLCTPEGLRWGEKPQRPRREPQPRTPRTGRKEPQVAG